MSITVDVLSERLRDLRVAGGISCRELDRLAGITPGHSWAIETGKRQSPEAKIVAALAGALGVSLDWLVNGEGARPEDEAVAASIEASRIAADASIAD